MKYTRNSGTSACAFDQKSISFTKLQDLEAYKKAFEWLQITTKLSKILICYLYRSQSENNIKDLILHISQTVKHLNMNI